MLLGVTALPPFPSFHGFVKKREIKTSIQKAISFFLLLYLCQQAGST